MAPSSEQTANWSIEKASSKVNTALSSCRSAWSRSRRRRGRRPHEVFGFASNVLIIDAELRKSLGQFSTLERASRSLAKTGFVYMFRVGGCRFVRPYTLPGVLRCPPGADFSEVGCLPAPGIARQAGSHSCLQNSNLQCVFGSHLARSIRNGFQACASISEPTLPR